MHYVIDNWSYDPFLIVVGVIVVLHEVGLRHLRQRSVPLRTHQRRQRSFAFYVVASRGRVPHRLLGE